MATDSMSANVAQEWRRKTRPEGMSDFGRWWGGTGLVEAVGVSPSDVDGLLHNSRKDAFLMLEFKPFGTDISSFKSQAITLKAFSNLPGCTALMVFDPHAGDTSGVQYDKDVILGIIPFINGTQMAYREVPLSAFHERIRRWWESGV